MLILLPHDIAAAVIAVAWTATLKFQGKRPESLVPDHGNVAIRSYAVTE